MTGDEDAFVAGFISAHPANKQPIIIATIIHFAFLTWFLLRIDLAAGYLPSKMKQQVPRNLTNTSLRIPWPLFAKEGECLPLEKGGQEGFSTVQSIRF
jgi:hypothetical protein